VTCEKVPSNYGSILRDCSQALPIGRARFERRSKRVLHFFSKRALTREGLRTFAVNFSLHRRESSPYMPYGQVEKAG
jgi:hypothetical protein